MKLGNSGKKLDVKIAKLHKLFQNRMFLIIAGSILVVALVGGIYSMFIVRHLTATVGTIGEDQASNDQDIVEMAEVLPQQIRSYEGSADRSWSVFHPGADPFGGPMKLTGVVIGGRSGAMAIIESSGTSYIVSEGDYVDDLWAVRQITRGLVILRAHDQEVSLYFDQAPTVRTLEYDSYPDYDSD